MRGLLRIAVLLLPCCAVGCAVAQAPGVRGGPKQFAPQPGVQVLVFVRHDCPVCNRYAPQIVRLRAEFAGNGVRFELVYPDKDETAQQIEDNVREYYSDTQPGGDTIATERDPDGRLVRLSRVTITPEAAVFDRGKLVYHGRIDDREAAIGKTRPAATTHELQDAIVAALAHRAPAVAYAPAVGCTLADVQ